MLRTLVVVLLVGAICSPFSDAKPKKRSKHDKPKKLPPLPDLCDPKQTDYLQESEAACICKCKTNCPRKDQLKLCKDKIKETCKKLGDGNPMLPMFKIMACAAGVIRTGCASEGELKYPACGSCISDCVSPESLEIVRQTMALRYECMQDCKTGGVCPDRRGEKPSDECKECADKCKKLKAVIDTAVAPPAPPV